MNRLAAALAAGAVSAGGLFIGATAVAGPAGADPWKCESCGYPFPKLPEPDDVPVVHLPGVGNLIPWGHLPEGWH